MVHVPKSKDKFNYEIGGIYKCYVSMNTVRWTEKINCHGWTINTREMEVPKMSVEDSYNSGCQKGEMQDWRGALSDYNSVIYSNEYIPKNVEISTYLNRGIAYYYIGSPSAAIEDWKKVIELASDDPNKRAKARNLIETVKRERGGY